MIQNAPAEGSKPHRTTVILQQKADLTEPTIIGVRFDQSEGYQLRVPVNLSQPVQELKEPPTRIEILPDNRIKVEMILPDKPTQITVDPDQILVDRDPANNHWIPPVRFRFAPVYTFLEETDLTCAYDRWNVIFGPWVFSAMYPEAWYSRSSILGVRAGVYRTQQYQGGVYFGYRPDNRDFAVGANGQFNHTPIPEMQLGFNVEKSLIHVTDGGADLDRAAMYARYIFTETSSLYLQPIHYVEGFAAYQHDFLPTPRKILPGTTRMDEQTQLGLHYHLDYLTPYWDPEGGFAFDFTYALGIPIFGQSETTHQISTQFSTVKKLPEWTGWFSESKVALRLYTALAWPDDVLLFTLGGNQLFRGYDMAERQGSFVWIGSVEWRIPIFRDLDYNFADRVLGLRNVQVVPFYDAGDVFARGLSVGGVAHAVGMSFRADIAWFGMIERSTFRFDVAKTVNDNTPFQFWIGIQHPF
jgi:hypothetical protein